MGGARRAAKTLPGESHVPGFPETPARLTREYVDAFMRAECDAPDIERMLHGCGNPDMGVAVVSFLPRYFTPRLVESARNLARAADPAVRAGAIGGLIGLADTTAETREYVRSLLRSPQAALRGRAAEYLCWWGIPADYQHLTKAAAAERDPYARAALTEAAAAIKRRSGIFGEGEAVAPPEGGSAAEVYQKMAGILAARPTAATRGAVITGLRGVEPFEPVTRYADRLDHGDRGAARLRIHRLLAGYPEKPELAAAAGELPVADWLIPPVRDFFDPKRKSYGILIKPELNTPFGNKYHVGDDMAWQQDHETVVAVGDGIVRRVELGRKSWGGLVVVEHRDAQGSGFCSLYGHLGPLVCVAPGQPVRRGQKLGAVGISYSHANGGYLAHLHFGIHRSAYLQPDRVGVTVDLPGLPGETIPVTVTAVHEDSAEVRFSNGGIRRIPRRADWTSGYLTPDEFDGKGHAWTDPQSFVRARLRPDG